MKPWPTFHHWGACVREPTPPRRPPDGGGTGGADGAAGGRYSGPGGRGPPPGTPKPPPRPTGPTRRWKSAISRSACRRSEVSALRSTTCHLNLLIRLLTSSTLAGILLRPSVTEPTLASTGILTPPATVTPLPNRHRLQEAPASRPHSHHPRTLHRRRSRRSGGPSNR